MLPILDVPPPQWGPDHNEMTLTAYEIAAGNTDGELVDDDDDFDNGLADEPR